jgi:hypothetical protein
MFPVLAKPIAIGALLARVGQLHGPDGDDSLRFDLGGAHAAFAFGPTFEKSLPAIGAFLDVGVHFGFFTRYTSRTMFPTRHGWLLGASAITGFGKYPTSAALELGYGQERSIIGNSFVLGPLVRFTLDDRVEFGGTARATFDVVLIQAGARLNLTTQGHGEALLTIGFGRF